MELFTGQRIDGRTDGRVLIVLYSLHSTAVTIVVRSYGSSTLRRHLPPARCSITSSIGKEGESLITSLRDERDESVMIWELYCFLRSGTRVPYLFAWLLSTDSYVLPIDIQHILEYIITSIDSYSESFVVL